MVLRMTWSGYKVRGYSGSIPGWVLKKEKRKKHTSYICIIYLICNIYCIYVLYAYYISYILHIYVQSKVSVLYIGLHLQDILWNPRDR